MNIRQANSSDSWLLSALCMDVQRLHAENYPEIFKMPQKEDFAIPFFDELLLDPAVRTFVAEEAGRAVGYVLCRLFERPESLLTYTQRFLQIEHISVEPAAQGRGVGTALIERVLALGGELNVRRIQLDSWRFNLQAHAFFEKMGFEKFNHRFWRSLE